jgi:hydrogenase-4 component E
MVDFLLAIVMLLNFALLGSGRIRVLIRVAALQGMVISALPLALGREHELRAIILAVVVLVVKGIVVPALLLRAFTRLSIRREVEPFIGFVSSVLLCGLGTIGAVFVGRHLPLAPEHMGNLSVAAALATVVAGFLLLITRRKAITQAIGYLVLENGISAFGLTLVGGVPFLVETGLLMDLVAGIFVMVIVMNHIQREFTTLDTRNLTALKE